MGPSVLGRNKAYATKFLSGKQLLIMHTMASVGLLYYSFLVAVKTDTSMILKMSGKVRRISISSLVAPFLAIVILSVILRPLLPDIPKGPVLLVVATNIAETGFLNLAPVLNELNLLTTDLAQIALSAAMLNDFILWFNWMVNVQKNFRVSVTAAVFVCGLISFAVFVVRPAMKWIIKRTPKGKPAKDVYILAILLGVLVMGFLGDVLSASAITGSLILGLVSPDGPPLGSTFTEKVEAFVSSCLLPFFFIAIGASSDVSSISEWMPVLTFQSIIVVGYLAKLLGAMVPAFLYGMSFQRALTLGLMMNMKGVMDIAMYRNLRLRKMISGHWFTILTLSSMTMTAIMGPLTKILYKVPRNFENESIKSDTLTIQATLLSSEMRILSCIHEENNVSGIIRLLEASNPSKTKNQPHMPLRGSFNGACRPGGTNDDPPPKTQQDMKFCIRCLAGFVNKYHLPRVVCGKVIDSAPQSINETTVLLPSSFVVFASRRLLHVASILQSSNLLRFLTAFESHFPCSKGKVSIQPYTMIAPFRKIHEGICRLAQDKRIPLIVVSFLAKDQDSDGQCSLLSKLNSNIQAYAPCTVGILVDRTIHTHHGGCENFSYHVAIIFIGGEDDREVLSYGARMSGNPSVSITLVRTLIEKESVGGQKGREMDNALVNEFMMKNINKEWVIYYEIRVNDWDQAIEAISSLEGNYDRIIVGQQQHGEGRLQDQAMGVWNENPELGMIGDMLVSSDFQGGTVSVLVMGHCSNVDIDSLSISMGVEAEKM
ncbi:hypothetical protein Nepgr_017266 [Nepenthes gracilis]|uniref:Cation/H+ exchanger domain-containing protein n=1 Tax=Nepenthes gracilis TaxID=150966 RepID=A0AAD3SP49_NEPGR|nr:hypothetical protein Nepgr_017266 [Nepenthes gracilis]